MSMAKKIKSILIERDMTIKDLSEKMGYTGTYLYNKLNRDKLTEEEFAEFVKYHLATCERQDLIGAAAHTLDILRVK